MQQVQYNARSDFGGWPVWGRQLQSLDLLLGRATCGSANPAPSLASLGCVCCVSTPRAPEIDWNAVPGKGTNSEKRRRFLVLLKRLPDPSQTSYRSTVTALRAHLTWLVGMKDPDGADVDDEAMAKLSSHGFLAGLRADLKDGEKRAATVGRKSYDSDDCESSDDD